MKSIDRFVVSCALTLLSGTALQGQAPSILEPKVERHQGPPLWISAEAVADEQEFINLALLDSPFLQKEVEKQRRELGDLIAAEKKSRAGEKPSVVTIPLSECESTQYSTGQGHRGGTGASSTLSDLTANSQSILRGTIRTIDLGFDGGVPASLLGIEVSEVIKGSAPEPLFYVLYPVAHFRIGPLYFCNTRQGFEPRPGDQILLFDYTGTVDRDQVLFAPRLNQILFQSQGGSLFLPNQLRSSPGMGTIRTLDEVVARMNFGTSPLNSRGDAR